MLRDFGLWLGDDRRRVKEAETLAQDGATAAELEEVFGFIERSSGHDLEKTQTRCALVAKPGRWRDALQAARAAAKRAPRTPGEHDHGETILRDNMAWEAAHTSAQEDKMALHAYDLVVGQRHGGLDQVGREVTSHWNLTAPVSRTRLMELVTHGAAMRAPFGLEPGLVAAWPRVAQTFLGAGLVFEWKLWCMASAGHPFVKAKNRTRLEAALARLPADLQGVVELPTMAKDDMGHGGPTRLGFVR